MRSIAVLLLFGGCLLAAPPSVESLSPSAGQRGTEFTLTLSGARLIEPQELLFDSPGIVCTKLTTKSETEVVATLKADATVKLGEHAFRLRTKGGASEIRTFHISPFPVIVEQEPNDKPETSQVVQKNSTISGIVDSADLDCYTVQLKKGERLSAEVVGIRLGGEFTDTAIHVIGPDGRVLAAADDTPLFRQDPFVSLIVPADGKYQIQLHDTTFGGSPSHRYLLHIGQFPRPASIFPLGGQTNTTVTVKGNDGSFTLKLPAKPEEMPWYPTENGISAPTPQPFRVSSFPNVNEGGTKTVATWPVAFNGIIEKPGEVDEYRFRAKKGDTINIEAFAYRLGTPTDTVVEVIDIAGERIGMNDDEETHDSRLIVNIPADGEYVVRVTDKRRQGGPDFVYRVELDRPHVGLRVFLPERVRKSQDRTIITVPRGNRVTAFLAVRRDGIESPVTLSMGELPKGVSLKLGTIPVNEYLLPVVFEAAPDAPLGAKLVPLTGTAGEIRGEFTQEIGLVRGPGDSLVHKVTLDKLAVVVVEESPVTVKIVPPTVPLVPDSTLDVRVSIMRKPGFAEAVELTFPSLPPGVEVPTSVVISPEKSEAIVTLVTSPVADLGDWKLIAEIGTAKRGRGDRDPLLVGMNGLGTAGAGMDRRRRTASVQELMPVASQMIAMSTEQPKWRGKIASVSVEQGQTADVVCELEETLKSETPFIAKLDGLPPRSTAQNVSVTGKTIRFRVNVDATTPLGEVTSLVCELRGSIDGQPVVYRVGRNSIFRVAGAGTLKRDGNGKTLSPLDALRQQEKK